MMTFHEGERAVQGRAGVRELAARVGGGIAPAVPPMAAAFLRERSWLVVGAVGDDGRAWATILAGAPGSFAAEDERTVRLTARPAPGDPLGDGLVAGGAVGLIAMDLASRRRMRLNGTLASIDEVGYRVRVEQVYANCPKYIQARALDDPSEPGVPGAPSRARRGRALSAEQRAWIERADTLFIATAHSAGGADVSHRGGQPGFIDVLDDRTLAIPDYAGNNMFQTLGNLTVTPAAGLLFVDFERGATLQLSGQARIDWDAARAASYPGARRVVELRIDEVVEIDAAIPLRWHLLEYSPFNPAVAERG